MECKPVTDTTLSDTTLTVKNISQKTPVLQLFQIKPIQLYENNSFTTVSFTALTKQVSQNNAQLHPNTQIQQLHHNTHEYNNFIAALVNTITSLQQTT